MKNQNFRAKKKANKIKVNKVAPCIMSKLMTNIE